MADPERKSQAEPDATLETNPREEHSQTHSTTPGDTPAERPFPPAETPAAVEHSRYRTTSFHARGGLGEVHVAEDTELHRSVALKRIRADRASHGPSQRRFLSEAEITARLEHPGIVPVYGLVEDADGPSYAMRFIEGESMQEAIARYHATKGDTTERRLEQRKLIQQLIDVCNTMAYAHGRGVIHRDLKPHNVMLGKYGETLVVDWGLAKVIGRNATISKSS